MFNLVSGISVWLERTIHESLKQQPSGGSVDRFCRLVELLGARLLLACLYESKRRKPKLSPLVVQRTYLAKSRATRGTYSNVTIVLEKRSEMVRPSGSITA